VGVQAAPENAKNACVAISFHAKTVTEDAETSVILFLEGFFWQDDIPPYSRIRKGNQLIFFILFFLRLISFFQVKTQQVLTKIQVAKLCR
jgi:hypothetical protein